ncbi:MAG: DNA-formamidopyrimidine glycosylase [Hyphomicrobiales bacterium]|nr:MAG: DNA-formamidopyrimidine glycosylase [Hyphomicrobiales bacterium]
MPELPEVETVRMGLEARLKDKRVRKVVLGRSGLRFAFPDRFAERLEGAVLRHWLRRGKYLIIDMEEAGCLIAHLGMSGRFTVLEPDAPEAAGRHDHVVITMQDGTRLIYSDPRRFGMMDLTAPGAWAGHRLLAGMGVEPLSNAFHAGALIDAARGRKTPIKAFLLDQRIIAGLGNIYVCEALYRAGIDPRRQAGALDPARELPLLAAAIPAVLREAIAAGGSSLRDYVHADGSLGYFQYGFAVYGRAGEPCRREGCGGEIARINQAGRSSFYCPACQH